MGRDRSIGASQLALLGAVEDPEPAKSPSRTRVPRLR